MSTSDLHAEEDSVVQATMQRALTQPPETFAEFLARIASAPQPEPIIYLTQRQWDSLQKQHAEVTEHD